MKILSYAVECSAFGPKSAPSELAPVVRHGTSDRRPPGREGVNHCVFALCEQSAWRGWGAPFRPSEVEGGEITGVAVCVECARYAARMEAVMEGLVADGIPLLHGGR